MSVCVRCLVVSEIDERFLHWIAIYDVFTYGHVVVVVRCDLHFDLYGAGFIDGALMMIRFCSDVQNHNSRIILCVDSRASKGAIAKGRSLSHRMNRLLRITAPHLIAANVQVGLLWIVSEENAPDDLTRQRKLREPDIKED